MLWATSTENGKQIDHVGRSLRTQNPRFEMLNTLPPNQHVKAIEAEHHHPSLMRDLALRINLQGTFAFRDWDEVPDVMLYSKRSPVGLPERPPADRRRGGAPGAVRRHAAEGDLVHHGQVAACDEKRHAVPA